MAGTMPAIRSASTRAYATLFFRELHIRVMRCLVGEPRNDAGRALSRRIPVGLEKSQPHFADGGKARHGVPQPVDGHPTHDGDGGRVQQFGDTRADESHTEQITVVDVDNHARPAGVAVCVELRSLHDVADLDVYRVNAVTSLLGLFGRQPDRGGFGLGEENLRHRVMVGGGGMGAPRRGVQRLACRPRRGAR
jgi:hypothetical protein